MAKRIETMSAKELYELAQRKEAEERDRAAQEAKEAIDALRAQRRELNSQYKKELAAIDRQINSLAASNGLAAPRRGGSASGKRQQGVSSRIVELIRKHGPIKLKDLRNKLESGGADTRNLGQTLAYLKTRGIVETPERAVYNIA